VGAAPVAQVAGLQSGPIAASPHDPADTLSPMEGHEIRRRFLSFFEERGHQIVPSSSLIPNDRSLLLTTAGMVQFKPYFLGQQEPPYRRAASAQKSFRTTDIELVGHTDRHMTFFEMLGNFSFGDYFKEDAVAWGWELVTEGFGLDPDRLWATVFETDDDAAQIWADLVKMPPERIVRRGKKDNFWWMGVAGPCGPCSEIYVDRGPEYGRPGGPDADEDRYLEIWNLVFMQNLCDDDMNIIGELPAKNVDTGMGLERMAVILQGVGSAFETDLVRPILETAEDVTGHRYGVEDRTDVSLRILAEHGRATTFLIADGVLPSNEGRGYVLRRLLRRIVWHARRLGMEKEVSTRLAERTIELMGDTYPELVERKALVLQVAAAEEESFDRTLRQGLERFQDEVKKTKARGEKTFSGEAAFRAHDTFGFPSELTNELAREHGLEVDTATFERLMQEQRARARAAAKGGPEEQALVELGQEAGRTEFLGYERLDAEGRLVGLVAEGQLVKSAGEGSEVELVLDRTPFYAEGGGQVGDAGRIRGPAGALDVHDTVMGPGETIVHRARVDEGEVRVGDEVEAHVDRERRAATARSHTGTHVLHWTLRRLLGDQARQAGSLVAPGHLRFDVTHFEGLSRDLLDRVEGVSNRRLVDDDPVRAYETTFDFARSQGAIALFGEKYGEIVRVVEVGDYSVELCGGTHTAHTGQVAPLLLASEGSIGSGVRRIEAFVGPDAVSWVNTERKILDEVTEALGAGDPQQAPERARRAISRIKELETQLGALRRGQRGQRVEELVAGADDVTGVRLVVAEVAGEDAAGLRELALKLRDRMERDGHGAAVLGSADGKRALLVASVTGELVSRGVQAPALLEAAAKQIGGGAGGKPHLAFAGGAQANALPAALSGIPDRLAALLGGE
jgi:alanyl-tRNA synthetase